MKKLNKLIGITVLATVFLFMAVACKTDEDKNSGGSKNPFVGTWVGYVYGAQATVVISSGNSWSINVPAGGFSDNGTYSGTGTVATLYSGGINVGTATAMANVDGTITTISLYLNQNSVAPGTYSLTKKK